MQNFTPFPLRARGSLEIFDAAIKLYKQYFWVLLGWSAIVSGATIFGAILPFGGMAALFITPLAIGSVVCCIAAAVRGQNVEFGQCWRFTQPRYWMMLGMHLLASLVGSIVIAVIIGIFVAVVIGAVAAFQQSSGLVQVSMVTLGFVILGAVGTILCTVFMSWVGLVPIVVCMEEANRGTAALGRAYDILRGHWLRITTVMALVGLAILTLFAILAGLTALVAGIGNIRDLIQGSGSGSTALWLGFIGMGLAYVVLWIVWTPLYYLILSVFYLDVRVRQEALDLEWTAHVTAPEPEPSSAAQQPLTPQPEYSSPAAMPTITPTVTPLEPVAPTSPSEPVIPVHPVAPPGPATPAPSYNTQRLSDSQFDIMNIPPLDISIGSGETAPAPGITSESTTSESAPTLENPPASDSSTKPERPATPERPTTPW